MVPWASHSRPEICHWKTLQGLFTQSWKRSILSFIPCYGDHVKIVKTTLQRSKKKNIEHTMLPVSVESVWSLNRSSLFRNCTYLLIVRIFYISTNTVFDTNKRKKPAIIHHLRTTAIFISSLALHYLDFTNTVHWQLRLVNYLISLNRRLHIYKLRTNRLIHISRKERRGSSAELK